MPYPVSAVSPDGKWAVSINYARLRLTRPDYGYGGNGQDARRDVTWPTDDGLWLVNLESGEAKLIVPIASVRDRMPQVKDPKALAYFCHTVFSRDGSKIFWLARSVENLSGQKVVRKWETTAFTCNRDGSNVRRCFPDGWGGSHFNWLDGERLLVTAKYNDAVYSHVLFTVGKSDYTPGGPRVARFRRARRLFRRRPVDGHRHLSGQARRAQADGPAHVGSGRLAAGHLFRAGDLPRDLFALRSASALAARRQDAGVQLRARRFAPGLRDRHRADAPR